MSCQALCLFDSVIGVSSLSDPSDMSGLTFGSSSSSASSTEQLSPLLTRTDHTSVEPDSGRSPDTRSPILLKLNRKSPLEIRLESSYEPTIYHCKGYDTTPAEYVYFDGAEGTPDSRFLIDLTSSSMERYLLFPIGCNSCADLPAFAMSDRISTTWGIGMMRTGRYPLYRSVMRPWRTSSSALDALISSGLERLGKGESTPVSTDRV